MAVQPGVTAPAATAPITERSAVDLAEAIRSRELSSREVVEAHIELIERRNPKLNAIVATRFDEARAEAEAADEAARSLRRRRRLGPLHGVPCTIKESFALAGMPHTSGSLDREGLIAERNASAVERLIDAGAIPAADRPAFRFRREQQYMMREYRGGTRSLILPGTLLHLAVWIAFLALAGVVLRRMHDAARHQGEDDDSGSPQDELQLATVPFDGGVDQPGLVDVAGTLQHVSSRSRRCR